MMLLINKADFLTPVQRLAWAKVVVVIIVTIVIVLLIVTIIVVNVITIDCCF